MIDVACGFTGHGLVGTCYTHEQVDSMRREDLEEMEHLSVGLEDETTDDDVYPEDSNENPSRVSFGPTSTLEYSA
jgi:hypothetical protein